MFFFNPFWPLTALRIASLKATSTLLLLLLIKSNLLRLKGGLIGGIVALTLISGLIVSTTVAGGAAYYIFQNKKSNDDDANISEDDVINAEVVSAWFSFTVSCWRFITNFYQQIVIRTVLINKLNDLFLTRRFN